MVVMRREVESAVGYICIVLFVCMFFGKGGKGGFCVC